MYKYKMGQTQEEEIEEKEIIYEFKTAQIDPG